MSPVTHKTTLQTLGSRKLVAKSIFQSDFNHELQILQIGIGSVHMAEPLFVFFVVGELASVAGMH